MLTAPAREWEFTVPTLSRGGSLEERPCQPLRRALHLAERSRCPKARWLDRLAPYFGRRSPVVFVNVGANKGYAVASILQRFTGVNLTNTDWLTALSGFQEKKTQSVRASQRKRSSRQTKIEKMLHTPCGACRACHESPSRLADAMASTRKVDVHAFELLDANVEWLRWAFQHFQVPGVVRQAIVSNETGWADAPVRMPLGSEFVTPLAQAAHVSSRHKWLVGSLPKLRLDSYMRDVGMTHAHLVSIDTEGYDALVLEGMRGALERHAVDVVEFEYHNKSFWESTNPEARSLDSTLAWLHAISYACFWQGDNGCLAPASGRCWDQQFEIRSWSNLVCARDGEPQKELWALAGDTGCGTIL